MFIKASCCNLFVAATAPHAPTPGSLIAFCLGSGNQRDDSVRGVAVAGHLCVAAMAVPNVLGQLSLRGAPSTTLMTTNLAALIMVAGEALTVHHPVEAAEARHRVKETLL